MDTVAGTHPGSYDLISEQNELTWMTAAANHSPARCKKMAFSHSVKMFELKQWLFPASCGSSSGDQESGGGAAVQVSPPVN